MTGEQLKLKLAEFHVTQAELREKLGMKQQNFSAALTVKDVKTGFIESICKVLGKSIAEFYGETTSKASEDNPTLKEALHTISSQQQTIRLLSELLAKGGDTAPSTSAPYSAAK